MIARLRPLAPPAAWTAILATRSLAGRGPVVLHPAADRVLVVAPHPDDETIGCGATLAGLATRGAEVRVLVASAGEASVATAGIGAAATGAARRDEAVAACAALGLPRPDVLALPDGRLGDHVDELVAAVAAALDDLDPDAVFVPWPLDDHPDHRAAAAAVARVELRPGVEVWGYEVWSAAPVNRIVDVTATWPAKVAALGCHVSAHGTFDPSAHLALGRWRTLFGLDGHGHAEGFLVLDGPTFRRLVGDSVPTGTVG